MGVAEVALVITGGGGSTVIARIAVPVPVTLAALMVAFADPVAVGVPEMSPVLVLTLNPEGRLAAPKLVGLLLAVI